jgi:putative FmdB family regulatory protein
MPVYEYQCRDCGVRFERRQHVTEDPIKICPECGGEVRRLIQPVGIVFKGSGFYVTDNRSKSSTAKPADSKKPSQASTPKASTESSSTTTSTSESSSESKSSANSE